MFGLFLSFLNKLLITLKTVLVVRTSLLIQSILLFQLINMYIDITTANSFALPTNSNGILFLWCLSECRILYKRSTFSASACLVRVRVQVLLYINAHSFGFQKKCEFLNNFTI